MDNVVESIFGLSPAQIQQRQNVGMMTAANNYASQDPLQRAAASMFAGGGMLAGAGAQAAGMMTPDMQQAQMTEQALQGLDTSDPKAVFERASQIQDPRLKLRLVQMARQIQAEQSKQALEAAQATKALRENPNLATAEVGVKGKPGWVQLVIYDKTNPNAPYQEVGEPKETSAAMRLSVGGGESKQPLPYVDTDGKVKWGTISDARGKTPAAYDPETKQVIAASGAAGKNLGEASSTAQIDLPGAESLATKVTNDVNELLKHPGFSSSVGATLKPGFRFIDGTKEASFFKRLEQIKGGAFLDAYTMLKGGGSITEVEGTKATAARNRMDKSSSEPEFRAAAKDFIDAVNAGVAKLKAKAAMSPSPSSSTPSGIPSNAKLIGHSPDNREVYQTPDGKKWVK